MGDVTGPNHGPPADAGAADAINATLTPTINTHCRRTRLPHLSLRDTVEPRGPAAYVIPKAQHTFPEEVGARVTPRDTTATQRPIRYGLSAPGIAGHGEDVLVHKAQARDLSLLGRGQG